MYSLVRRGLFSTVDTLMKETVESSKSELERPCILLTVKCERMAAFR